MFIIATIMIAVKDLTPGLILSHAIITPDGKTLLGQGGTITERTISLLSIWNINYVHISVDDDLQNKTVEATLNTSHSFDISAECAKFFEEYDTIVTAAASSFDFIRSQNKVPITDIKDTAFIVYSSILTTGPAIMDYLLINDNDLADEVSRHSVMVAYICGIFFGNAVHLNKEII